MLVLWCTAALIRALGCFALLDKMQNYGPNFGELRSVHRPATAHMWFLSILALGPLMLLLLSIIIALDEFISGSTRSQEGSSKSVSNFLICQGALGLLLAIIGSILISDFREWSATKTVKLSIYQKGFTYESDGRMEACRWGDIKDINFRFIEVTSKALYRRRVKVIRSIVKKDGTVISLAGTLNLERITNLISLMKKELG